MFKDFVDFVYQLLIPTLFRNSNLELLNFSLQRLIFSFLSKLKVVFQNPHLIQLQLSEVFEKHHLMACVSFFICLWRKDNWGELRRENTLCPKIRSGRNS